MSLNGSGGRVQRGSKRRRQLREMAPEGKTKSRVGITKPTLKARKERRRRRG